MRRHRSHVEALRQAVLEGPGRVAPALRQAASRNDGSALPEALRSYVDRIERHAYRVTDEEVEELKRVGYSDDQLFEITVAAALGASLRRLEAGLAPLAAAGLAPLAAAGSLAPARKT